MSSLLYKSTEISDNIVTGSSVSASGIEAVTEDMKVKPVEVLKNCLVIPKLNIKVPIVEGVGHDALAVGVGHFPNTPKVGEVGNSCYAGHYSTVYNCIFNDLPKIKLWDEIHMYDNKGKEFIYYVDDKFITQPTDIDVLSNVDDSMSLTIVTCAENGTKRLIVKGTCESQEDVEAEKERQRQQILFNIQVVQDEIGSVDISSYLSDKKKIKIRER